MDEAQASWGYCEGCDAVMLQPDEVAPLCETCGCELIAVEFQTTQDAKRADQLLTDHDRRATAHLN